MSSENDSRRSFTALILKDIKPLSESSWNRRRLERIGRLVPRDFTKPSVATRDDVTAMIFPALDTPQGPLLTKAIHDGMHAVSASRPLSDHGGGVKEASLQHMHRYNGPGISRVMMQLKENHLLQMPNEQSEIPEFETLAYEVATRMIQRNQDIYAPVKPTDLPKIADEIADRTEKALSRAGHRVSRRTSPIGTHILSVEADPTLIHQGHTIVGIQKDPNDFSTQVSEITFAYPDPPKTLDILIGSIHPQGNPNWPLTMTQLQHRDESGNILGFPATWFSNAEPRTQALRVTDNRNGCVNNRQHMSAKYLPDGTVIIPPRNVFLNHQPRIPESILTLKNLGSLAVEWTRLARYGAVMGVFADIWKHKKTVRFPDSMPKTRDDMRRIASRMIELFHEGQVWDHDKDIELATDATIAMHHGGDLFLRTLKFGIPFELHREIIPRIQWAFRTYGGEGSWTGCGDVLIVNKNDRTCRFTSGISDTFRSIRFELEEYRNNWPSYLKEKPPMLDLPQGSSLAQFLWWSSFIPSMKRSNP